jgi:protein pelota
MQIINKDIKKGIVKLKIENQDDLWYLSHIIDKNDNISGKTVRKIKIGEEGQRNIKIIKKTIFLKILSEKIEYTSNTLRITGKIVEAPEDVPINSYHSFNLEENTIITIIKNKWLKFQLDKLNEASTQKISKVLIVVLDREEANFALMQRQGYKLLSSLKGQVNKKAVDDSIKSSFYSDIIKTTKEYDTRYDLSKIVIASPLFWREELIKELNDEKIKSKIIQATCSATGQNGINEVLKRPELKEALKQDRVLNEINIVEKLLSEISKNEKGVYGIMQIKKAVGLGAVDVLILTDNFIQKAREKEKYEEIDLILKNTESMKGTVHIISSNHEGGKKLNGLGGIGGILRYKLLE